MKIYEDYLEGIAINDKLRDAILVEESERYETINSELRKEFLFLIFKHLVLGGSVCQYEDFIEPYTVFAK